MEINNEVNVSRWVRERLTALSNDDRWQPDLAGGLARLRGQRSLQYKRRKRRIWTAVGIASALIALTIFPTTRALAGSYMTRCINQSDRMRAFFFGTSPRFRPAPSRLWCLRTEASHRISCLRTAQARP